MDIENDRLFNQWVRSRNIRETSIIKYHDTIKQYCNLINKTPTDLIQEARADQINFPWISDRKINDYLFKYQDFLKDYSYNTKKNSMVVIRSFYRHFEIDLPKIYLNSQDHKHQYSKDIPGQDDIKSAINNCSIKYQAIILLMSSSGMGRSEILDLKIYDFLSALELIEIDDLFSPDFDEKNIIAEWHIKRFKTGYPYICFSSPESTRRIIKYLKSERKNIKSGDFLFIGRNNNQLSKGTFVSQFRFINDRCDFGWNLNSRYFTSHKLRKFFATTLTMQRVPEIYTQWFLGHKIDSTTDAYFKLDPEALRKEYIRILPYLTITEKVKIRTITDERLEKMESDYKLVVEILKRHNIYDEDLDQLGK